MASDTKLTYQQVKQWFNNRRAKLGHVKPKKFPSETIEYLKKLYEKTKYPSDSDFRKIVSATKLDIKQAKKWFFSTRYKLGETKKKKRKF